MASMKVRMDRMEPKIKMGRSTSSGTLLSNMNVARLVATAFGRGDNAVGPRMLGLKQGVKKSVSHNSGLDEMAGKIEGGKYCPDGVFNGDDLVRNYIPS